MKRVLIFGATSAIARATARLFAERGDRLFLVARDAGKLEATARDLQSRGAEGVDYATADLADETGFETLLGRAAEALGGLDVALIAYGTLPEQGMLEGSPQATQEALHVNFTSVALLLTLLANQLAAQRSGTIAVISSVAGDRGRASNYVYGTAKGAVSLFLQGLRNRLHGSGVHVLTIKPGLVDTPMTAELKKNFLYAKPDQIAAGIISAIDKKRDVVYLPFFWRWIMLIIRALPEPLFKRLSL